MGLPVLGGPIQFFGGITMIRNLNQVSFQGYGIILPERAQTNREMDKSSRRQLQLDENNAIV